MENLHQINKHAGRNNHAGRKNLENLINVQVENFQRVACTRLDECADVIRTVLVNKCLAWKIFEFIKSAKFSWILDFHAIFSEINKSAGP